MRDDAAQRPHAPHRVVEKDLGIGAAPLRIAGRKMRADIAVADRAEHRVGDRMQRDIGVGMADSACEWGIFTPPSQT